MLFDRGRVEEDLERIRKANLTPQQQEIEDENDRVEAARLEVARKNLDKIGLKDIFAMTVAVFSLIIPYILIFGGIIGGIIFLFYQFVLK